MDLKNMALSPEEQKEEMGQPMLADQPRYPYGLCIELNDDAIARLGLPALPQVGQTVMIQARAEIQAVRQYDTVGRDKESSISLQITDLALGPDDQSKVSAEKALYGG